MPCDAVDEGQRQHPGQARRRRRPAAASATAAARRGRPRGAPPARASSSAGTVPQPDARVPLGVQRRERSCTRTYHPVRAGTAIASTIRATATTSPHPGAAQPSGPLGEGARHAGEPRRAPGGPGRRLRCHRDVPAATSCCPVATRARRCAPCCPRVPDDVRRHRRRQRLERRHRDGGRASSGPRWCASPAPGTAPRCTPGCWRPRAEFVAVMDGDGSFDPARPAGPARRGPRRPLRPGHRSAPSGAPRGVAVARARRQPRRAVVAAAADRAAGARHRADAGLPPRGAARPRRAGPALRLPRRAAAEGAARRAGGSPSATSPTCPRAEGTRSKVSGSVRGTVRAARDFARVLS